jgi:gas vesicle protein
MAKDDVDERELEEQIEGDDLADPRGGTGVGFLVGLVVGALVGAGTALLLAPARGDVTRRRIGRRFRHMRDQASDRVGDMRDDAERELRRARRKIKRHLPDRG